MNEEYKKLIYRAGIIPYYLDESKTIKMLFMRPSMFEYGSFTFQIGKGRVEDDDVDHRSAALREGAEELGLFKGNTLLTEEVGVFMGRTTLFVTKIKDPEMFGLPDEETESTRWMTMEDFMLEGRELHRPPVQACYRTICKLENILCYD